MTLIKTAIGWTCLLQPLLIATLWAQTNRGAITGTVLDPTQATVPGVQVTATNSDTGVVTTAVTNNNGIYSVLNLPAGAYSLRFSKTGFKPVDYPTIILNSMEVAQLNVTLQVGSLTETITVTDNAPLLDKETSDIGTNLKGNVVTDLPLNIFGGRAIESFAVAITPGYAPLSDPYYSVINGTQGFTKDFTVDGTSGTAQIQGDSIEVGPTMEAVGELHSETSGLSPQNGITNGGIVMFNLKSGTNKFHGSVFGFGHNELFDANTWDNDRLQQPKPKARFWDYGFSAGGPIRANKSFVFGAFERFTQHDFTPGGFGGASTVPTQAFLGGDFSTLLQGPLVDGQGNVYMNPCTGQPVLGGQIFNPATARTANGQSCADPFPGNKIPTSMFSTVSQKVVALYQKYYAPEVPSLSRNDRLPNSPSPAQTPNQAVVKLDHNLSDLNRLSGSWIYNHRPRTLVDTGGVWAPGSTDGGPLANARDQLVYSHEFRASDSYSFRPDFLNVLNLTYNWYWNGSLPAQRGTNWPAELGFGNTGSDNFPSINFGRAVNGTETTFIGNAWQDHYVGTTLILSDNASWTKGRHTVTFGGDFRAMEINSHAGSGALSFNFSNNTTGAPTQPYANQVGSGFASFLLGDVQSASESTPLDLYGRRKAMSLFVQDHFKATPKLTFDFGTRWDATFRFHEKYGHWANFDLNAINPDLGIPGAILYAKGGSDSFEKQQDWTNFGPQIGFAYSPSERWVFRGSLGILYVPIGIQYYHGVPYGYAPGFRGTNAADASFNWDQGYPGAFVPGTIATTPPITQFPVVNVNPRALLAGYTENLNAGVQYELTRNTRIDVNYIGNRGHRLQDSGLANNQPGASTFFELFNSGKAFNYVCDPGSAAAIGVPYPYPGFCGPAEAAIAPYPQLALAADTYWFYPNLYYVGLPLGQSFYDSLVVELVKRTGSGLTMDLNYTLSRQLANTVNNFGESFDIGGIQDFSNLKEAAHTLSPYDQKHVVKGYVTYRLPFGRGKRFLGNKGRWMNGIIGDWTLSGLVLYASGQPLTFYSSNYYGYPAWAATYVNYNLAGYNGSRFNPANFTPPTPDNPTPPGNLYFPSSVATNPPLGQLGQGPARTDTLRGPGIASENASLLKYFRFGADDRFALSVRVEFYNIFNRHHFGNPITDLNNPQFGFITGVNSAPRQGQFGARFEW